MSRRVAIAVLTLGALAAAQGVSLGQDASVVVDDPKDTGKLYEPAAYARCDIRKVESQVKRGKLVTKVTLRGSQEQFRNTYLHLNTKGNMRSEPEFVVDPNSGTDPKKGDLYKTGGVDEFGAYEDPKVKAAVPVSLNNSGKAIEFKVPLKKIGSPPRTGFQAKTCGEGAVDIAPGGTHFDDKNFTGRPDYEYKNIETGG